MQKLTALAIFVLVSESLALKYSVTADIAPTRSLKKKLDKGQLEIWYVNLKGSTQREQCVEGQLKRQGLEPHRFNAVKYPTKCDANEKSPKDKNCFRKLYGDCMKGGINRQAVTAHTKPGSTPGAVQKGVISNWCSHKRILDQFANDTKASQEKYYVILEDDVIISPTFARALESFIATYPNEWKYIQVDPFGAPGTQVAFHQGQVTEPGRKGEKRPGDNYGMHCLVVKQSEVEGLLNYFSTHEVVPIDWITKDIPGMITWTPNIAQNPEGHNGDVVFAKPPYCKDGIYKSDIAGEHQSFVQVADV